MITSTPKVDANTVPLDHQQPVMNFRDGKLIVLWGHHLIQQARAAGHAKAPAAVYVGLSVAEERILAQRYAAEG